MRYAALAAVLLLLPQMAPAQRLGAGRINLIGSVARRCTVVGGGQVFSETINLGELAGANGQLRTDLTDASPDAVRSFSLVCTSGNPRVRLSATRLSTPNPAPAGYASDIDYTARVTVRQASGTPPSITYTTASTLPPPTDMRLTAPLANAADNVTLSVYSFLTPAGALLFAGSYSSTITIIISPA